MSPKLELVKKYYDLGLWSENRVHNAVLKNWITEEESELILNKEG